MAKKNNKIDFDEKIREKGVAAELILERAMKATGLFIRNAALSPILGAFGHDGAPELIGDLFIVLFDKVPDDDSKTFEKLIKFVYRKTVERIQSAEN